MSKPLEDPETERFYKLSYFFIPIPMVLGLIFAGYVLITEDSRNMSYCTVAKQAEAYQQVILNEADFESHEAIPLNICKDIDDAIDDDDGRSEGRVHWFVCKGTVCGKQWQQLLAQPL